MQHNTSLADEEGGTIRGDNTNLGRAILNVMKQVQYVEKRGRNEFHAYNYATEADVVAAIRKGMVENDLILIPHARFITPYISGSIVPDGVVPTGVPTGIVDSNGITHVEIEYILQHVTSGERITVRGVGSGSDKNRSGVGDKGTYKALTGCHKYMLLKLFMIETGDDPERETVDYTTPPPPPPRPPVPPVVPPPEKFDDDPLPRDPRDDEGDDEDDEPEHNEDGTERERDESPEPKLPTPGTNKSWDPMSGLTKAELNKVVAKRDGVVPVLKEPGMGDEAGHPWEIVEEIFKQFIPLHEDLKTLREFYKVNMGVLQIMEREAPKRKRKVDAFFTEQKNTLNYRDKEIN